MPNDVTGTPDRHSMSAVSVGKSLDSHSIAIYSCCRRRLCEYCFLNLNI